MKTAAQGDMLSVDELLQTSGDSELAVFSYWNVNLGDHIQTLALLQHVAAAKFLFRDSFSAEPDLVLAANGWMTKSRFPSPQEFRAVRYLGVHIAKRLRTAQTASALRGFGTIGCRDLVSARFLGECGLPTCLCLCATLTFPRYEGPRQDIICVDVSDEIVQNVTRAFGDRHGRIVRLTHHLDRIPEDLARPELIRAQYLTAYHYLQIYRRAALVVTSRVHVALPSIAFGTPVIVTQATDDRYSIFESLGVPTDGGSRLAPRAKLPWHVVTKPASIDVARQRRAYLDFLNNQLHGRRGLRAPPVQEERQVA